MDAQLAVLVYWARKSYGLGRSNVFKQAHGASVIRREADNSEESSYGIKGPDAGAITLG